LSHREKPDNAVGSVAEAWSKAAGLFDERRFFEAHEFLEYIWKSPEVGPGDRPFWKGLTQIAAGYCHCQRGNARGAVTVLRRAVGLLGPYPSPHRGVDTRRLIHAAQQVVTAIGRRGASAALEFPRLPLEG
jgi:predicted metal-dependent hydrolase